MTGWLNQWRFRWQARGGQTALWVVLVAGVMVGVGVHLVVRALGGVWPGLLWLGPLALAVLSGVRVAQRLLRSLGAGEAALRLLSVAERLLTLSIALFVVLSGWLAANALMDQSPDVPRAGEIVAITETDLPLDMTFPITWATVRFADDPEATPRVLLGRRETSYVWVGQSVIVHVRSGALGVPWVRRVERDDEQYYRKVLATFSDAAEAWKGLVRTYFDQRRWQDAERAALDYLARYPNDYEFAYSTASEFAVSRHYGPTVAMLEPFLGRRQDYVFYNSLGWSLAHVGQVNRGIELLKSSIPLDPNNFWAYYHLGYLYVRTRQTADAIEMFRNVLERRPNFPEVEAQLRALENGTRAKPPGAEG